MSYIINKTDGSVLTEVVDGTIDQTATDLTLIGKNSSSYGEFFNENLVHLLENFASTTQPNNPILGQLWFDTSEGRLKVYDASGFKVSGGTIVSNTPPTLAQGDIWIDSLRQQLYFNDGSTTLLAGPGYTAQQGISGFQVVDVIDTNAINRTVVYLYVAQTLIGLFSKDTFKLSTPIAGFTGSAFTLNSLYARGSRVQYAPTPTDPTKFYEAITNLTAPNPLPTDTAYWKEVEIQQGFNVAEVASVKFNATATQAEALVDQNGSLQTAESFLSTTLDSTTSGQLTIANTTPLVLGPAANNEIRVTDFVFQMNSNTPDQNFAINLISGSTITTGMYIDAANRWMGINTNTPAATLDINGDVIIRQSLTVEGNITAVNSTEINIEDKLITLSKTENPDNSTADGSGFVVEAGTDVDKEFLWSATLGAWNSTESLNLEAGKGVYVDGFPILNKTTLGPTVNEIQGTLTGIGVTGTARLTNLTFTGSTITFINAGIPDGDIVLVPKGDGAVDVSNAKITNVLTTTTGDATDATNRGYVDNAVRSAPLGFSLDTTGFTDEVQIAEVLTSIFPPIQDHPNDTVCNVHCVNWLSLGTRVNKEFIISSDVWSFNSNII